MHSGSSGGAASEPTVESMYHMWLGPNGLPRKKGGNPQAKEACSRHAAGNCSFKFCSFKH